ncbi:MAG: hypothetical protein DI538_15105 [Azospira oryzae]|nr:MAG: hypothetical protein DI538_15105 [Azospira oryzae]
MLGDFLNKKSEHTLSLFWHFISQYQLMGEITIHPTRSMIALAAKTRIAYIIRLGKDFVDVVFPFSEPYNDNLCFHKIAQVPGTSQYNHHLRITHKEDVNAEVKKFMKMALKEGK